MCFSRRRTEIRCEYVAIDVLVDSASLPYWRTQDRRDSLSGEPAPHLAPDDPVGSAEQHDTSTSRCLPCLMAKRTDVRNRTVALAHQNSAFQS